MSFDFDAPIERRQTNCAKWDELEAIFGVSTADGLPMWTADMDFRAPPAVNATLQNMVDHGVHGYFGDSAAYHSAIVNWMDRRHDWRVDPECIATTHGLVTAIGLCLQAFTAPGDRVILFTPVYHVFSKMVAANEREVVEAELVKGEDSYHIDFDALEAMMTGQERMVIFCSPHNPIGKVWSAGELAQVAQFCEKHDLILISDEIHHDLVYPGFSHTPMINAAPKQIDRIVMLTAASKTFNLAGGKAGQVTIPNEALRARFARAHAALGTSPNRFGVMMTTAAYAYGEDWLEALLAYLNETRRIVDDGLNAIPGVRSMPLGATYLAWVDFRDTGMEESELRERIEGRARVVGFHGKMFGAGGAGHVRFNFAMTQSRVRTAVERLQEAFADLQ